jgi:hypothetical protein
LIRLRGRRRVLRLRDRRYDRKPDQGERRHRNRRMIRAHLGSNESLMLRSQSSNPARRFHAVFCYHQ